MSRWCLELGCHLPKQGQNLYKYTYDKTTNKYILYNPYYLYNLQSYEEVYMLSHL